MLVSHPKDWHVKLSYIIDNYIEGKAAVYRIVQEAIKFGYMGKLVIRDERGRIVTTTYWVTCDPKTSPNHPQKINENCPLPENQEMDKKPLPENRKMGDENVVNSTTSRLSVSWKSGSASLYNKINIKAAASSFYENSELAYQVYCEIQERFGFRKAMGLDEKRRGAIEQTLRSLSLPGDHTGEGGFAKWCDLLERASCSPWYRGECEPRKGFSQRYRLSIDCMTNPTVLEKLVEQPLRFGPDDDRWTIWKSWAETNDKKLHRIMTGIEAKTLKATDWTFENSFPPTGENKSAGGGHA